MAVQTFSNYGAFATNSNRGGGFWNWKNKGFATVWLHMTASPIISYRHNVPTLIPWEDKDTRKKEMRVWSKKYVCHESTGVLADQHKYDDKAKGTRITPPVKCGICKFTEWARIQCLAYERTRRKETHRGIELTQRIFDFAGDREEEHKVLRMGGVCNLFGWKDLKLGAKKAMQAANNPKIIKNGWDQNLIAKPEYGFFVVPDDDPDHGVRFTPEAGGLGQKFQTALAELMDSGVDPSKTPIGMRWIYKSNESFDKMYAVQILREEDQRLKVPSKRIRALLEGKTPDVPKDFLEPFNQLSMKMSLMEHCTLDVPKDAVPWDKLFPSKAQIKKWAEEEGEAEKAKPRTPVPKEEDSDLFKCDECEKPMKASDTKCPHCGHQYDVEGDEPKADAKGEGAAPKKKKKKKTSAAAKSDAKPAPSKTNEDEGGDGEGGGEDDDIPF